MTLDRLSELLKKLAPVRREIRRQRLEAEFCEIVTAACREIAERAGDRGIHPRVLGWVNTDGWADGAVCEETTCGTRARS